MSVTAVVGILGGGQLGRMLALAGIPLGLRFRFLERDADCPAASVGEVVVGDYSDAGALERFARGIDVATYEFENVPAATARWLTEHVPVFPPEGVLAIAQDRLSEKQLFQALGIPTPAFAVIDSPEQLRQAAASLGFPLVIKTRRLGYDGKGQAVLRGESDLTAREQGGQAGCAGLIAEAFVPFVRELSILAARSRTGEEAFYPLTQNMHEGGILRESRAPADGLTPALQDRAESLARRVLDRTGYVGVLAIELFELPDGTLLANEMAPRVHNSGHWTMDGAECSQFENHLRAILGWPLGSTRCESPTAMINLLGPIPDPAAVLAIRGAHLHLYGKSARAGGPRKIGHINVREAGAPDDRLVRARMLAGTA